MFFVRAQAGHDCNSYDNIMPDILKKVSGNLFNITLLMTPIYPMSTLNNKYN
jgi:hypothetical protein